MTEQSSSYEDRLQKNFLDAWIHYLEFNINRYRRIGLLAGSPIKLLIAQVIYWHELLILAEKGTAEQFMNVRENIKNTGKETFDRYLENKKLTITLISSMTGLPFETTRRQVKAMEASGLIEHSEVYGLLINKNSEFHQKISTEIVQFEQEQIVKLIEKVMD